MSTRLGLKFSFIKYYYYYIRLMTFFPGQSG